MHLDSVLEQKLATVIEQIRQAVPSVIAVYVFGSCATGTTTPESDVDVAVLPTDPLTGPARWYLAQTLAMTLGRDVDLVDLRQASTVMRVQVLGSGELLFEGDRAKRQEFEAVALGAYARLNEERRGIIADIRARGSVYG
jgi:predicted nucleotidyltransferase